jgi:hypothetical protein
LFLVVGFKSWFEFKVVCSLIGLEERFGNVKEKEKKKRKQPNRRSPAGCSPLQPTAAASQPGPLP